MMGSVITVKLEQAHTFNADFLRVGRRKAEGFGAVRLYDADKLKGFKTAKTAGTMPAQDQTDVDISWFTKALQAANPSDAIQLGREIYATVKGCFNDRSITSSLIGRLMLMTEEAVSMEDMKGRIASIKKKEKKEVCEKVFAAVCDQLVQTNNATLWKDCWMAILRLARYDLKGK